VITNISGLVNETDDYTKLGGHFIAEPAFSDISALILPLSGKSRGCMAQTTDRPIPFNMITDFITKSFPLNFNFL
jgi:hypothetical protein